jgi:hypothetical protein
MLNIKFPLEVVQRFRCGRESKRERLRLQYVAGVTFMRALVRLNGFAKAPRHTAGANGHGVAV